MEKEGRMEFMWVEGVCVIGFRGIDTPDHQGALYQEYWQDRNPYFFRLLY